MNRNNERHFNQIPEMKASRTRFNRDQTILTTFDSGKLIPFYVDEVLPGDTFSVDTSAIIRMTTPKYPVMDDAFIDRKSTRLNSSHSAKSRMPSSA